MAGQVFITPEGHERLDEKGRQLDAQVEAGKITAMEACNQQMVNIANECVPR